MRFTTALATSAAVTGALAGYGYGHYEEKPTYTTIDDKVYTSVKTCSSDKAAVTDYPVYEPTTTEYPVDEPVVTEYPGYEVTYTSYEKITVTSCGDYVTDCPVDVYTSTAYSVSTCVPATSDYYVPPTNTSDYYVPPAEYPTETPTYEAPVEYPTETLTYYTTVCPGKDYCYATTVTYCPGKETSTYVPTYVPVYETTTTPCPTSTHYATETPYEYETPTYVPEEKPTYTPTCPGGYDCPSYPSNETTYTPPQYTGAGAKFGVSIGALAVAGLALFL